MAHGVEVRAPLVDMKLLATLAPNMEQILAQPGKRLLANLIDPGVGVKIMRRAKTGFTSRFQNGYIKIGEYRVGAR